MERLEKRTVPISQIKFEIAKEIGEDGEAFVRQCFDNKDYKSLDRLFGWRYAYGCDFQPEFYFMKSWYEKYKLQNVKLSKAFIDIETDLIDFTPDLDRLSGTAHAPVNCVTVVMENSKESYTFILRPYEPSKTSYLNPEEYKERYSLYESQLSQHESLMNDKSEFINELNKTFEPAYGPFKYAIREYVNEIDLIADVFKFINDRKPNFCLAWNMRFDIQYLLERIKVLGYEPRSIICHQDFKIQKCYFHVDKMVFQLEKQYDYFFCSSYTHYICQMRLFGAQRKSQQMLKSISLNAIADRELKDKKVEYPSETNMVHFPYVDWKRFITYNIKDVMLQVNIERKTNDVMAFYKKSHSNLTPYNKIFRETHLLRNVREMYFNREGWVQGNNLNIINSEEDEIFYSVSKDDEEENESTFKGAIMADPIWNDDVGIPILDRPSNIIFKNLIDMDMASFYPVIKIVSNMDPGTLLYKAEFNNEEFMSGEYMNKSLNTTYQEKDKNGKFRDLDIAGEAINSYLTGNDLTFGYNWLNLPSITELIKLINKELN
jgi:DNA polymerase elongation subunit (family B)